MNVNQMRIELLKKYNSRSFGRRLAAMPDSQVIAIYFRAFNNTNSKKK